MSSENKEHVDIENEEELQIGDVSPSKVTNSIIFANESTGCFEVVDTEEGKDTYGLIIETKEKVPDDGNDEVKIASREMPLTDEVEDMSEKNNEVKITSRGISLSDETEDNEIEEEKKAPEEEDSGPVAHTTSSTSEVPVETGSGAKDEEDAVIVDEETPLLANVAATTTTEGEKGGKKYAATLITHEGDDELDIESDGTSEAASSNEGVKPLQPRPKIVRQASKVVQKVYDENIKPLVEKVEQHTKPVLTKINNESAKFVNEKVAPHTTRVLKQAGESTRKLTDETKKITDKVGLETKKITDKVGLETKKITDKVGQETKKVVDVVGRESMRAVTHVNSETKKIATQVGEHTKRAVDHVSTESKRALEHVDKEIKPVVQRQAFLLDGTARSLRMTEDDKVIVQICDGTARSFGLVIFCDNPMSGFLIWIAMMITHPLCGLCAFACAFLTNLFAYLIDLDLSLIRRGSISTNAVLVGSGLISYLTYQGFWGALTLVMLTVLVAPCASLLAYIMVSNALQSNTFTGGNDEKQQKVPALLFPYVSVMMIMILCAFGIEHVSLRSSIVPPPLGEVGTVDGDSNYQFMATIFHGISYIFLPHKPNILAGCLMFVGIITCSRVLAFAALIGSKLGAAVAILCLNISVSTVNSGFMGFNVVLTLMSLCFYIIPSWRTLVLGFVGLWLTVGVQTALMKIFSLWSIPIMVLPYCLSMLPFVAFDFNSISNRAKGPFVQTIPLEDLTTPEQHFSIFGKGAIVLPLEEKQDSFLSIEGDQKWEDEEDVEAIMLMKEDVPTEKEVEIKEEAATSAEEKEVVNVVQVSV